MLLGLAPVPELVPDGRLATFVGVMMEVMVTTCGVSPARVGADVTTTMDVWTAVEGGADEAVTTLVWTGGGASLEVWAGGAAVDDWAGGGAALDWAGGGAEEAAGGGAEDAGGACVVGAWLEAGGGACDEGAGAAAEEAGALEAAGAEEGVSAGGADDGAAAGVDAAACEDSGAVEGVTDGEAGLDEGFEEDWEAGAGAEEGATWALEGLEGRIDGDNVLAVALLAILTMTMSNCRQKARHEQRSDCDGARGPRNDGRGVRAR